MPMYETTVLASNGDKEKKRIWADNLQEAQKLFEQLYGPRAVPYIPHIVTS